MVLSLILGVAMMQGPATATAQPQLTPLVCPMTGEATTATSACIDFAGTRYPMCCGGCPDEFKKSAATAIKSDKLNGKTFGVFLFDPISNAKIDPKTAKASSDFKGTRYYFATADEKTTFDASPKKFTKTPVKEVLFCAVAGHAIKSYDAAGGYQDINGTRYYTCCTNCLAKLKADASLASKAPSDQVKSPAAMDFVPKQ
jgi:YHS domain-containing protein